MQAKQEKWDLYDQQGRKTGKTIQAGENVPYGYCLYCVGIWVIDSEKKILLTKRSSQKRYAPGKWENTGGHMISDMPLCVSLRKKQAFRLKKMS